MDADSGYWQVRIAEEDKHKTAFTSHAGFYEFNSLRFGLKNAPATFQRVLDIFLSQYKWQIFLVYIDDVIFYSKTVEQHIVDVYKVLVKLARSGMSLCLKKCSFFTDKVKYLGHVIRPGRLEVDLTHVAMKMEADIHSDIGAGASTQLKRIVRYPRRNV